MCLNKKQPQYIVYQSIQTYYILWFLKLAESEGFEQLSHFSRFRAKKCGI